ncbi:Xylan 1,4-beta-xylosidase precursor [compost metagenome]
MIPVFFEDLKKNKMRKNIFLYGLLLLTVTVSAQVPDYLNYQKPVEVRVQDLLKRMTVEEKASQVDQKAAAIPRLKVPEYNWWNEALHGVARAGLATSYPQPIGLAATFNTLEIYKMGVVVSDEARAKHHQFIREGKRGIYEGLTFYSPNVNIFRDPRWGRGHETFGEDPYLTGTLGVAFVKAMQGDNPNYYKTICTAKHFAVHSGPEKTRHSFNANPSKEDVWETYLPAFKMLAMEGKVYSFMCAYNSLWGEPCCTNPFLLSETLRKKWGFKGFVATDCGVAKDLFTTYKVSKDSIEGMARTIKAGVDSHCWGYPKAVVPAIEKGYLKKSELDTAVARLIRARIKLGMFDDDSVNPYSKIPMSVVNCEAHQKHALKMARESMVLLKNKNNVLPLSKSVKSIAVLGPNANDKVVPLGNYNGQPADVVTVLEGIKNVVEKTTKVEYMKGCFISDTLKYDRQKDFVPALALAKKSDVIVFVGGISPGLEGENGDTYLKEIDGFDGGDKTNLDLPSVQTALLKELKKLGKPIIFVMMNGSALAINWENDNLDGIVEAWYGGQAAGQAVADVLFNNYNPSGKMPLTFYKSMDDVPSFDDYSMDGKTYRYYSKPVLYPFGYGLSYSTFAYSNLKLSSKTFTGKIKITVTVKNTGKYDGDEVMQCYIHQQGSKAIKELKGFQKVHLKKGESKNVIFELDADNLMRYNTQKDDLALVPGKTEVMIGVSSQDIKLKSEFEIK